MSNCRFFRGGRFFPSSGGQRLCIDLYTILFPLWPLCSVRYWLYARGRSEVRRGCAFLFAHLYVNIHRHRSKLELLTGDGSLPGHGLAETSTRLGLHEAQATMARPLETEVESAAAAAAAARAKLAAALLGEIETRFE